MPLLYYRNSLLVLHLDTSLFPNLFACLYKEWFIYFQVSNLIILSPCCTASRNLPYLSCFFLLPPQASHTSCVSWLRGHWTQPLIHITIPPLHGPMCLLCPLLLLLFWITLCHLWCLGWIVSLSSNFPHRQLPNSKA